MEGVHMKPGKKPLLKPKMKRVENLLSTPKSEEATDNSQVVNGLNQWSLRCTLVCIEIILLCTETLVR